MNLWKFIIKRAGYHWQIFFTLILGVIFGTGLLVSGPLIINTVQNFSIPYKLNTSEPLDGNIRLTSYENFSREDYYRFDDTLRNHAENRLGEYISTIYADGKSGYLYPWVDSLIIKDQRVSLNYFQGLEEKTYLLDGEWPRNSIGGEKELRVVISESLSENYNLKIGDQLPLSYSTYEQEPSIWFLITGIITPYDIQDPFWFGEYNPLLTQSGESFSAQYSAFISEEEFFRVSQKFFPASKSELHWIFLIDPLKITPGDIELFNSQLNLLRFDLKELIPKISLATNIDSILNSFNSRSGIVKIILYFILGEVLFLAIYYIVMISGLLVEYLGGEFSNLSSRGGSFRKLLSIQVTEATIIAGLAFIFGILLALVMVWGVSEIGPIADVKKLGWRIQFSTSYWIAAGIGVLICMIGLLIPIRGALKRNIVTHSRGTGRVEKLPIWQKYYLDVFILLLGIILLWRFYFYGGLSEAQQTGYVDWLLLLSPLILLVSSATILYRIFAPIMRGLSAVFSRGKDAAITLAFYYLSRNPANVSRLALLLTLTMALGILTSGVNATLDASEYERALYAVGSPVRLEVNHFLYGTQIAKSTEIEAASSVFRSRGSVSVRSYRTIPSFDLLAIDPFSLIKVTKYRSDYAPEPMGQVLGNLVVDIRQYEYPSIDLPDKPVALGVWLFDDTLSYEVESLVESIGIRGKIQTAGGDVFITTLQLQSPVDEDILQSESQEKKWYYFEGSIPALDEDSYPLSLHSLWFNIRSADFRYWQPSFLIDDISLRYQNKDEIAIDDFENLEHIWQVNSIQADVRFTRQKPSHSGSGSLIVDLPSGQNNISGIGIFPAGKLSQSPIPVLASEEFLDNTELEIGNQFFGDVNSIHIPMVIVDRIRYFPSMYDQPGNGFLVVPRDPLLIYLNQEVVRPVNSNELWIETSDVNYFGSADNLGSNITKVFTIDQERKAIKADPLSLGLRTVTLISYLVTVILSLVGFSSFFFVSARARVIQFGVLRSLGMSINQLYSVLFIEQIFLIIAALTIGLALGLLINLIVLPDLPISLSEKPPIPPFLPHMNWRSIFGLYASMIVVFIFALGISSLMLWKAKIHEALRIGME